jgi:hypothetical protein
MELPNRAKTQEDKDHTFHHKTYEPFLKNDAVSRNFNYGRFEISYIPTGELSPERTEEA